jgi:hypothetical protein
MLLTRGWRWLKHVQVPSSAFDLKTMTQILMHMIAIIIHHVQLHQPTIINRQKKRKMDLSSGKESHGLLENHFDDVR